MPPAAPSRRTVKLPQSLNRDLSVYALAAGAAGIGAVAMPQPAQAQIVYTPAHEVLEAGSSVSIDFNHDGITDVTVVNRITKGRSHSLTSARASMLAIPGVQPYGGVARRYYNAAGAFRPGEKIGSSRSFDLQIDLMCTAYLFLDYYFGSWMPSATNRYLGVRFTLNGTPHFGWVRLNTTWREGKGGIKDLITGYAYQTQPGTAIAAGDRGDNKGIGPAADSISESSSSENRPASLGALALGAAGLPIWRRP
jgi:hypothetical protein